MTFQTILLYIHSYVRWLAILVAAVALVRHVIGLVKGGEYDRMSRGMLAAFSGLLDLNAVLGIAQLVIGWQAFSAIAGGFPLPQIEHLGTLLVVVVVAHLPMRWKNAPGAVRYRNGLIVIVAVLALIVLGVTTLQGSRWVLRGL
jgi:hypothetical protein